MLNVSTARMVNREEIQGRTIEAWLHEGEVKTIRIFECGRKVHEWDYNKDTSTQILITDIINFFEALKCPQ